jgi:uncharacterized protein (TIGR00255 family)
MTAYARAACEAPWGRAAWELRGVNNRYLDAVFRLPEELRGLEAGLREQLQARVKRGKLELALKLDLGAREDSNLDLDLALAGQLTDAARRLQALAGDAEPLRVGELLRWPGVIRQSQADMESIGKAVGTLLEQALDDLVATREREGGRIETMIRERCDEIESIVALVRERQPELVEAAHTRLNTRLAEVRQTLDPERLEQEMVILANKLDVAEELDRLDAHLAEIRETLSQRQPIGRRLDFLMQELNREANTLGSKSGDTQSTRASVDLKVLIEQMREQIQNLE